jgi:pimeloyl-ACP methyl ester carboxylesterase
MFTINLYALFEHLPNARLLLYPDSGHGFLFQNPQDFAKQVCLFL